MEFKELVNIVATLNIPMTKSHLMEKFQVIVIAKGVVIVITIAIAIAVTESVTAAISIIIVIAVTITLAIVLVIVIIITLGCYSFVIHVMKK